MKRRHACLLLVSLLLAHTSHAQASDEPGSSAVEESATAKHRNWAHAATIFGIVTSSIVFPAGLVSDGARPMASSYMDANYPQFGYVPIWVLIPTVVIMIASPPIVAAGAASARKDPRVTGFEKCRVAGWVLYGIATASSVAFMALALHPYVTEGVKTPLFPPGPISVMAAMGATAGALFAIDSERSAVLSKVLSTGRAPGMSSTLTALPFIAPAFGGAIAGIGGTF